MNLPNDLTILATAPAQGELFVEWDPAPPAISPRAAAHIESRWAEYFAASQASGHPFFNGRITRLIGVSVTAETMTLRLGPGEYKAYLVALLRDRAWFQANAPEAMVPALGNSALVTRGDQALLALRGPAVSCYPERIHTIGGVLEALGTPRFPASRAGIEAHLFVELEEEIGLRAGEECRDGWPRPLAIARDHFLQQPELFWQWEVKAPLEELQQRLDPAEHSTAFVLTRKDMTPELWRTLTPVARLAWKMWTGL